MSDKPEYMENDEGVHLMTSEFTLCGDAFDLSDTDEEVDELRSVKTGPVTCPRCIDIILKCRGVRVRSSRP